MQRFHLWVWSAASVVDGVQPGQPLQISLAASTDVCPMFVGSCLHAAVTMIRWHTVSQTYPLTTTLSLPPSHYHPLTTTISEETSLLPTDQNDMITNHQL